MPPHAPWGMFYLMHTFLQADAEAKLAAFKHQKEVRAADLLDQRRQLEQMKLEQANDKLFQEKIEECTATSTFFLLLFFGGD